MKAVLGVCHQYRHPCRLVWLNWRAYMASVSRMFHRWSLCTLYLLAHQVRVTVGDSGLRCARVTFFER